MTSNKKMQTRPTYADKVTQPSLSDNEPENSDTETVVSIDDEEIQVDELKYIVDDMVDFLMNSSILTDDERKQALFHALEIHSISVAVREKYETQ